MSIDQLENELSSMSIKEMIRIFRKVGLLKRSQKCDHCDVIMLEKKYEQVDEGFTWRCNNKNCNKYRNRKSIRCESFFNGFRITMLQIIKILLKWSINTPQVTICSGMNIDKRTVKKVINKFLNIVKMYDTTEEKMGGPGILVEIDETALNHNMKAHRGRAPRNKTDALCIVEVDYKITRAFACVIPNKKAETMLPIIVENVEKGSKIWTDEHKSYSSLNSIGYSHDTVCHKREFVNQETGVNTQAVESFNNEIKLEIKRRKGIRIEKRQDFLHEFVWKFNNRHSDRFIKILHLIKINNN